MENNTIGGVSPLKAKKARQSSRGGKEAGYATGTAKRRGGFARSTGKRGAGGRNVGGYNVQTSFAPSDPWKKPPSGGTTIMPEKPYTIDKNGKVKMNDPFATKKWIEGTPGETTTEKTLKESQSGVEIGTWDYDAQGRGATWKEAWELNLENIRDKYSDFDKYVEDQKNIQSGKTKGATKDEIDKSIYETKTVTREGTPGHWKYYDENGDEISKAEYSKYKNKR